ncbi:methyltransferase [Rhodobacteraceae bacterium B1Z28]|uniref:Methyltransferase n=1 Tax=Ruegeria haliotis TaxID=2747601 RepID=A0ABX2PU85_9RHOB|nr:methyltransferase [Ruegeria haliotis]NVO56584.1 methyltransferase [Ruegeria haliotis]
MIRFDDSDLTCNDFLGGRVRLLQPVSGYRAGVDPVLLAASVSATSGQSVLELGCGAGAAILCLAARVTGLQVTGVEVQPAYAELARRNAAENQVPLEVIDADLGVLPSDLRQRQFDHVIANPPYYRSGAHSPASDQGRSVALGEQTPLADWIEVAAKRLAPRGYLHMIQKADRLPDMLSACAGRLGAIQVLPLCPRQNRSAELVILRARKGGRAAFQLHAPLFLHRGEQHVRDGESYTSEVSAVLRDGEALLRFQ